MPIVSWPTLATTLWPLNASQSVGGGLYQRIDKDAVANLVGATSDGERDAIAMLMIAQMADFYRQKLTNRFNGIYSDTLTAMQREYARRIQMAQELQSYQDAIAGVGDAVSAVTASGSFAAWPLGSSIFTPTDGVYGYAVNVKPGFYIVNSASQPIDGNLLKGTANNGDYAGDINPATGVGLYINYGTAASPSWTRADNANLVDHIQNPEEIRQCGYNRAIAFIKFYGVDIPAGASLEWRYAVMPAVAKMKRDEANEQEAQAFSLLQIDRSGGGIISDYDRAAGQKNKWFF